MNVFLLRPMQVSCKEVCLAGDHRGLSVKSWPKRPKRKLKMNTNMHMKMNKIRRPLVGQQACVSIDGLWPLAAGWGK